MNYPRSARAFTVVELAIIIAVIAILATIGTVSYLQIQKTARDDKREADATAIQHELETFFTKYGEYPSSLEAGESGAPYTAYSTHRINSVSTAATISAFLPGVSDNFGDPNHKDASLFSRNPDARLGQYFYRGGMAFGNVGVGLLWNELYNFTLPDGTVQKCKITHSNANPGNGQTGYNQSVKYVFGYYLEKEGRYVFIKGRDGGAAFTPNLTTESDSAQPCEYLS